MANDWVKVDVQGLDKLHHNLLALGEDLSRKVFPKAARKANNRLRDRMRELAPRGTHPLQKGQKMRLHEGILQRTSIKSEGVRGAMVVILTGLRKDSKGEPSPVVWGRFLEFGTVKMSARPWMRPAFDSEKAAVLQDFANELRIGIEQTAAKFGVRLVQH